MGAGQRVPWRPLNAGQSKCYSQRTAYCRYKVAISIVFHCIHEERNRGKILCILLQITFTHTHAQMDSTVNIISLTIAIKTCRAAWTVIPILRSLRVKAKTAGKNNVKYRQELGDCCSISAMSVNKNTQTILVLGSNWEAHGSGQVTEKYALSRRAKTAAVLAPETNFRAKV